MSKNGIMPILVAFIFFFMIFAVPIGHIPIDADAMIGLGESWCNYTLIGFNYQGAGSYINPMTYTMTLNKDGYSYSFSFQSSPVHVRIEKFNFTVVDYDRRLKTLELAKGHIEIKKISFAGLMAEVMKRGET